MYNAMKEVLTEPTQKEIDLWNAFEKGFSETYPQHSWLLESQKIIYMEQSNEKTRASFTDAFSFLIGQHNA